MESISPTNSASLNLCRPWLCGGADGPLLEKREKWRTPSSLVLAFKGKTRSVLSSLMRPTRPPRYRAITAPGTASSTLASRRNFAASSGGVGLM